MANVVAAATTVGAAVGVSVPVWNSGLCDCCSDCGSCMDAFCCPWCTQGYQANKIEEQAGMDILTCLGSFALDWLATGAGSAICGCIVRDKMVKKYGLLPDNDCCKGFCCFPCSIAQVQREMTQRLAWPGGCCSKPIPAV